MRAIANGQVENFPPADQLKTVYVEHDIQVCVHYASNIKALLRLY
jgi:elongation factor 3